MNACADWSAAQSAAARHRTADRPRWLEANGETVFARELRDMLDASGEPTPLDDLTVAELKINGVRALHFELEPAGSIAAACRSRWRAGPTPRRRWA